MIGEAQSAHFWIELFDPSCRQGTGVIDRRRVGRGIVNLALAGGSGGCTWPGIGLGHGEEGGYWC